MFIESIILHNYRAYRGHNETSFKPDTKNMLMKNLEETSTMLKDIRIMLVRAYIRSLQMLLTHMKLV